MQKGFTLIELMVVIAIIIFLSVLAIPSFKRFLAKAKRAEAYTQLHALYAAEKAHWAEHGTYTSTLAGRDSAGWSPEGYKGGGKHENFYYTYGFSEGGEGTGYFTGKLETSASNFPQTYADTQKFRAAAVGDIMASGKPDILTIDQDGTITLVQNALE